MAQVAEVVGPCTKRRSAARWPTNTCRTPQGLFEMKYFFAPGFETTSGGAMSNTSVKEQISKLIEREDQRDQPAVRPGNRGDPERPGIRSTRTVAKYHNELNILPSNIAQTY